MNLEFETSNQVYQVLSSYINLPILRGQHSINLGVIKELTYFHPVHACAKCRKGN